MTYVILDRLNAWKLKQRLPFYVQLAHACPEDLDAPQPHIFLISISEVVRGVFDFLQWRHPVKRSARRDFVRAFNGDREIPNAHEKAFFDWRKQCWKAKSFPHETATPPYMNLFPSVLRALDEEYDKFLADKVLSNDALAWFENALREGDEDAEYAYLEESVAEMQKQWSEEDSDTAEGDWMALDEAAHKKFSEYDSDDYGADEERYASYENISYHSLMSDDES